MTDRTPTVHGPPLIEPNYPEHFDYLFIHFLIFKILLHFYYKIDFFDLTLNAN